MVEFQKNGYIHQDLYYYNIVYAIVLAAVTET